MDFKFEEGTIEDHSKQFMKLHQKLMSMPLDMDTIASALYLRSLPSKYDSYKIYLSTTNSKLSLRQIINQVTMGEVQSTPNESSSNALISNQYKKTKCQICGYTNHKTKDCRRNKGTKKPNYQGNKPQKEQQSKKNEYSLVMAKPTNTSENWIVDSGASDHITYNKNLLIDIRNIEPITFNGANGQFTVTQAGTVKMELDNFKIILKKVYYAPQAGHNLLSVQKLASVFDVKFTDDKCEIFPRDKLSDALTIKRHENIYVLKPSNYSLSAVTSKQHVSLLEAHKILGHLDQGRIIITDSIAVFKKFEHIFMG
jgi:hypothetical protein